MHASLIKHNPIIINGKELLATLKLCLYTSNNIILPICRLTSKEYFILVICFYSMAGTLTIGGWVVTVRVCRVLWRREKEWSGLGWPYSMMKL